MKTTYDVIVWIATINRETHLLHTLQNQGYGKVAVL